MCYSNLTPLEESSYRLHAEQMSLRIREQIILRLKAELKLIYDSGYLPHDWNKLTLEVKTNDCTRTGS